MLFMYIMNIQFSAVAILLSCYFLFAAMLRRSALCNAPVEAAI